MYTVAAQVEFMLAVTTGEYDRAVGQRQRVFNNSARKADTFVIAQDGTGADQVVNA